MIKHARALVFVGSLLILSLVTVQVGMASTGRSDRLSADPVTLVIGMPQHPYTDSLLPLIQEFEDSTGITVHIETYPEEVYMEKRASDIASGAGEFDVVMLDQVVTQYARSGWIEPLDAYFNNPALADLTDYDMNDLLVGLRRFGMVDGKIYGIPVNGDAEILYYRQDLFEQQGLAVPTTMDELYQTAVTLNTPGQVAGICLRGRSIFTVMPFSGFLWSYGGQHFDDVDQPQKATFNSPAGVAALELYARLLQDAGPPGVQDYSWEECTRDFQQGKVAMYIDSSLLMASFEDTEQSTVSGLVGYAPLPAGVAGSLPNSFGWMMGINAASKSKDAAFQFIVWATGKDISLRTAIQNGASARESVWRSPEFLSAFPHPIWADVTVSSMKNAGPEAPWPRITQMDDFLSSLGGAINQVIAGDTDAQTALDAAAARMDTLLGEYEHATYSQETPLPGRFSQSVHFDQLADSQGFAQRTINSILQDRNGFMWFGTDEGLYKYDGYRFTLYEKNDADPSVGPSYNFVSALYEDQAGNLWVGTWGGGLSKLDPTTQRFTHYQTDPADPNSLSNMRVRTISEDQNGTLWIGTFEGGLNAFDPVQGRFTRYQHNPDDSQSLSHDIVWSIIKDHADTLWIGTADGLDQLDPTRREFVHYRSTPGDSGSLSNGTVLSVYEDSQGTLWVGTRDGLNRLDRERGQFVHYQYDPAKPGSLSNNVVMSIYEDRTGTLWVGTEDGLNALDRSQGTFIHYTYDSTIPNSMNDNRVRSIYQDRSGLLWIGTQHGVNTLNVQPKFTLYQDTTGTPDSNYVRAVYQDNNDALWIGTNNGLFRFGRHSGESVPYTYNPQDINSISAGQDINVIYADHQGYVWLGGWGTGLNRLDPHTGLFRHYRHQDGDPTSLSQNTILSIYQDHRGVLWIGTNNGLNRFDPQNEQFTAYYHQPGNPASLAANDVRVIYEDDAGILWLGSWFGGLTRFDPVSEQFKVYQADPGNPHSLSSNAITTIYQDQAGVLWLGTADGLDQFDRQTETFSVYTQADGLSSNRIRCILEDDQGSLWISSVAGLGRFDPNLKTFTQFATTDGLQGELFTESTCYQSRSGEMFFGGSNGLNSFYPDNVRENSYAPPVVLTDLRLFDVPLTLGPGSVLHAPIWQTDHLTLSHHQNSLSFEFSALSYINAAENRYRYRLVGFDDTWHEVDSEHRAASYSNLSPGHYVFRVQATNNDGVWSNQELALALTIVPPWWDTWLFRGLVIVGVLGIMGGTYRWRVRAGRRQMRRLERLVDERTTALRESERTMTTLISNLPGVAYRCRNDRTWTMEFISEGCLDLTGYPPAAFIDNAEITLADVIHPEDREELWQEVQAALETHRPFQSIYRITTKGGQKKWVWEQGQGVFDNQEQLQALEGLITDITERRQMENDLHEAKEAAEAANRAKSLFLANMSHELRTPLNAILGFGELLAHDTTLNSAQQQNLTIINRSGEHLLALINDVLELSKIEADRVVLREEVFDLHRLLDDMEDMFHLRAIKRGVSLTVEWASNLPRYVCADEGRLRQVFINLLGNAVKFTNEGHIVLRAGVKGEGERIHNRATPPRSPQPLPRVSLVFEVEDTGVGIASDELDRIFDAFSQAEAGRKYREGSGLGLTISRQFVRLMGGDISVSSKPGKGSIFRFDIQVALVDQGEIEDQETMIHSQAIGLVPGQPVYRLLVVEDVEANRQLLVQILQVVGSLPTEGAGQGLEVREASNGQEAIEIWEDWAPHLIWMDMHMPVMDGHAATRHIKSTPQGSKTIIVALTASAFEEDREYVLASGCDDFVRKPFRQSDIVGILTRFLGLQFIYQREEQPIAKKQGALDLSGLPAEWYAELRRAATEADGHQIVALAERIQSERPALTTALIELANNFDYDSILAAIDQLK